MFSTGSFKLSHVSVTEIYSSMFSISLLGPSLLDSRSLASIFFSSHRKTRAATHVVGSGPRVAPKVFKEGAAAQSKEAQRLRGMERGRCVLWFYASHERDVVPLLEALASARASHASMIGALELRRSEDAKEEGPLFDEVCFMEFNSGRPSRFTPPTARELLSRHDVPVVSLDQMESNEDSDPRGHGSGDWQRTLEQVTGLLFKLHSSPCVCHILFGCFCETMPKVLATKLFLLNCAPYAARSASGSQGYACSHPELFLEEVVERGRLIGRKLGGVGNNQ